MRFAIRSSQNALGLTTVVLFALAILAAPTQQSRGDDPQTCGPPDPENGYRICAIGEVCENNQCVPAVCNVITDCKTANCYYSWTYYKCICDDDCCQQVGKPLECRHCGCTKKAGLTDCECKGSS
jgi:hypothetical protein